MSVTARASGKLYLAGEYAILEPTASAILFGVDRYLYCTVRPSERGQLHTSHANGTINWVWDGEQVVSADATRFDLIFHAITLVGRLTGTRPTVDLTLTTELERSDGQKYGLGSSAAVTVAVLKAMLAYCDYSLPPLELFKLACIVQHDTHHNGSYGDLAAAVFGGCIAFHNFDHELLKTDHPRTAEELRTLLASNWDDLTIQPLDLPDDWRLAVAWTETPASTEQLIQQELTLSESEASAAYQHLVQSSTKELSALTDSLIAGDYQGAKAAIAANRETLTAYTQAVHKPYWTASSENIVAIARQFSDAVKISGAGGGDCVIALAESSTMYDQITTAWQAHHYTVLPLHISKER